MPVSDYLLRASGPCTAFCVPCMSSKLLSMLYGVCCACGLIAGSVRERAPCAVRLQNKPCGSVCVLLRACACSRLTLSGSCRLFDVWTGPGCRTWQ